MPSPPLRHYLVALWFADIVGYSECAAEDERRALDLVEMLQRLARNIVEDYEGRVVKFIGDAVLAEFPSTELAVRAAAVLRREYVKESTQTGRTQNLRIGIHVGDVAVSADGDLYGDGVNAAARIQAAIDPGQVGVSEDVWRQTRARPGFRFEELGDHTLKGVGRMRLYAVAIEEGALTPRASGAGSRARGEQRNKPGIRSIAVLPFADLSPERDQEYFSDGVAEEILNALTKVGDLRVPARTSSFAFRGAGVDVRDIGKRLGVEALLEGSIRKAGQQLRITVQLISAQDGYQLWSQRFDRELQDIFAIQDEIAHSVLTALGLSLTSDQERRLLQSSTRNMQAYEFYLRGRKFFQKWTRQNIGFARDMFKRAIELDPNFAGAWAGLASAGVHLFGWGQQQELDDACKASRRALELDPDLAEAHVAAAQALSMQRRYAEAATEFDRAIELDPTLFDAYYYYARSCFKGGDLEKALRLFRQAERLRPEDYQPYYFISAVLRKLGRGEEAHPSDELALNAIKEYLELNPDEARPYSLGCGILARRGDMERARQWNERAMSLAPDDDAILYNASCLFAILGEDERAMDALEQAIDAGLAGGDWLIHDPDIQSLCNHPRFQSLMKRIAPS